MRLLSSEQTAELLYINLTALSELVNRENIPHTKIRAGDEGINILFNPAALENWLTKKPEIKTNEKKYLNGLKRRIEAKYPKQLRELKKFSSRFSEPKKPKGYNLTKVPNKKLGFVYYVRYIVSGKLVFSRWTTRTSDREAADRFAKENRERILKKYYAKKENKKPVALYYMLKNYYSENSHYLQIDARRGRTISDTSRMAYHNFIVRQFMPYLKKNKISGIEQIDTPFLARFQNYLLTKNKPQTIGHYISYISLIFDHLLIEGSIKFNPCESLTTLKVRSENCEIRGCYEVNLLYGVFNKRWKDEYSYLLCLMIYTTGMRNSEIEKIQLKDIILIGNYRFIDIPKSKTKNGIRIVPLHEFAYKKITRYMNTKSGEDYIFTKKGEHIDSRVYSRANLELAKFTGYSAERLGKENITFYSGRHFWKTLMNSEDLGDIEEYFMGHKISGDVAKRYNHKDKQGKKKLLEKAKKVFYILDKRIFRQ
jgi:integrase